MDKKSKEEKLKTEGNSSVSIFDTLQTNGVFISVILFISLAVYSNTLLNGFVFDDDFMVLKNNWIKDIRNIPEIFTQSIWGFKKYSTVSNYYRPLMHIIYMFNYHIFGLKPWGFHLINILLHAGVSVLVYLITKELLRGPSQSIKASLPAFIAALLFATHPIHTEAVAWVASVAELSYTLFFLLAFYLYIKSNKGFNKAYLFSIVSFALATLCKEPALTLPIIIVAYDYVYRKNGDLLHDHIKRYLPYITVSVCYLLIRAYVLRGFEFQNHDTRYFINISLLFSQYMEKLLLPLNLNALYAFHPISSIFEGRGVVSVAITVAFFAFSVIAIKKRETVSYSFLLIAVPLMPVLYIYPLISLTPFAERYLYLPSVGFVLLIAIVLSWIQATKPKLSIGLNILAILLIGLYSIGTISRNAVWKNDYTLFSDTVKKSPDSAAAHNEFGHAYQIQDRIDEAIYEYQTALKLKPDFFEANENLHLAKAIKEYQTALEAHNNLGVAYLNQGRIDEAIKEFKTTLMMYPNYAIAHYNLGNTYRVQGRTDEAIDEYQTALKLNPDLKQARQSLDILLKK